jgi:hypothetical protein
MSGIFDGMQAFGQEESEGVVVQYGMSKTVVQVEAEATMQPAEGINPVALARQLAPRFNMPSQGLVLFVDGNEVPFREDMLIPTTARRVEFRMPGTEKGAYDMLIELDPTDGAQVTVVREETVIYLERVEEPLGNMELTLVSIVTLPEGVEVIDHGRQYAIIGRVTYEPRATRRHIKQVMRWLQRTEGGMFESAARSVNDFVNWQEAVGVILNGEEINSDACRDLVTGDELLIVLPGETHEADFDEWAAAMRTTAQQWAVGAEAALECEIAARREELDAMSWLQLQRLAKGMGGGLTRAGKTQAILGHEFPLADREGAIREYLEERAPELLD